MMDNNIKDESITFTSVVDYIKENFIGLVLFFSVFVIIYVVDHINSINSLLFASPSPIPGVMPMINSVIPKIISKGKKHKKHIK